MRLRRGWSPERTLTRTVLGPGGAKLTPENVIAIKRLLVAGHTKAEIAKDFGVNVATIRRIAQGFTWGDCDEVSP